MTPLERAARALYERDTDGRYPIVPPGEPFAWEELTPESKQPYFDEARAVLAAIREPDDRASRIATRRLAERAVKGPGTFATNETWRAMIDAMLAEEG